MAKSSSSSNRGSLTSFAAVGLIGLGIYFGTQLKAPGPGGDGSEVGVQTSTNLPEEPMPELPEQPPEPALEPLTPPEMITVMIRDDGFVVERSDMNGATVMALPEIADLAATTTGTTEGIRVRVTRHVSAMAGDQERLYQALTAAGLRPEQLQQISGFIE